MKTVGAWSAGACVILAALASLCGEGCKSSTNSSIPVFGDDDSGSGATGSASGSSGGTGGSSSGGAASGGSSSAPSPEFADGGISCGAQGGCAPSEECCYPTSAPMSAGEAGAPGALGGLGGFGGGIGAPATTCTQAGSCTGSSLGCSSTQHCSGGEVCCFVYQASEAGAAAGGFAGFGAPMAFTAECADECPGGDMIHYQLCASSSECPNGQQCVPGTYTTYCNAMGGGPAGGAGGPNGAQGGDDDGGSD
jgi:hypothetical protein